MAVARKSDVSATGSWFRTAIENLGLDRSTSLRKPSTIRRTRARSVPVQSKVSVMSAPLSPTETFQRREVSTQQARTSIPLEKPRLELLRASVEGSPSLSRSRQQFPKAPLAQRGSTNGAAPMTPVQELDKQTVPSIPVMSIWLLRLYSIHRHSSIVAFLLVTVTLVVYGWTVYSQQLWSQSYRNLQKLQHYQRQLTTNNEVLKEKMAQEAQRPAAGLVSPTPTKMIFWPLAPQGPNPVSPNTTPNSETQQQTANPVGY
ncbi:MAG: hypothetical protein DSM106950_13325 [Stigonema ocellatum SAG 48.90 = DSM 106950]|nr:hypothetical protein [Stigonema ocellatum SAG 48.90 = DSM 106950]